MKSKILLGMLVLFFAAGAKAQSTVTLNWVASTTAGVTYNVYRETVAGACTLTSTGAGPACLLLNSTPLTVLTFTDLPPANAQSFYVVRAFNSSGVGSVYSNEISVNLVPPAPPGPLTCTFTITGGSVAGPIVCK